MIYAVYIAAVDALAVGALLYRRRKVRKRRHRTYGYVGFPPGRHTFDDRIEFFCGKRRD